MIKKNILTSVLCLFIIDICFCQQGNKPPVDINCLSRWNESASGTISPDGKYISYTIQNPSTGKDLRRMQNMDGAWIKNLNSNSSQPEFSINDMAFYPAGDSLCQLQLGTLQESWIFNVKHFELNKDVHNEWLTCLLKDSTLLIRNLHTGKQQLIGHCFNFINCAPGKMLLYQQDNSSSGSIYSILLMDLNKRMSTPCWKGTIEPGSIQYDLHNGGQLAFSVTAKEHTTILYWKKGMKTAKEMIGNPMAGINTGISISLRGFGFNATGEYLFFTIERKRVTAPGQRTPALQLWDYRMEPENKLWPRTAFKYALSLQNNQIQPLENDSLVIDPGRGKGIGLTNDLLLYTTQKGRPEWWNETSDPQWQVYSLNKKKAIWQHRFPGHRANYFELVPDIWLSPGERYVLYFDSEQARYFAHDLITNVTRDITGKIPVSFETGEHKSLDHRSIGIAGWYKNDRRVLLYDRFDIWEVDPSGLAAPKNLTRGYGVAHHLRFRLTIEEQDGTHINIKGRIINGKNPIYLSAFNTIDKSSGFYRLDIQHNEGPIALSMAPYYYTELVKADHADVWIIKRESANEAPNIFWTNDLKTFHQLTDIAPHKEYNWLNSELITYALRDGSSCQAILYKPENYDPAKKYPVIFNYYEDETDELHKYLEPGLTHDVINVPWMVSRGYLVCMPDIHFDKGDFPGDCALNSVESAAKYLINFPWVNSKAMGLQGHSYGGFSTNYIVTHSSLFAAAVASAGLSDNISCYNALTGSIQNIDRHQHMAEVSQERLHSSLWEDPECYIRNSSIFYADKVITPLLLIANPEDKAVPQQQSIEMFLALRRLGKPCWFLQYAGEDHGVFQLQNVKDYNARMIAFFDHYLKDTPLPAWMTGNLSPWEDALGKGLQADTIAPEPVEREVLFNGKLQKMSEALKTKSTDINIKF